MTCSSGIRTAIIPTATSTGSPSKGRDLYPVVVGLLTWGDRWMPDRDGPPVALRHKDCDHLVHPELACPECGEWIEARDIAAEPRGAAHG